MSLASLMKSSSLMKPHLVASIAVLLGVAAPAARAQRPEAKFEWQKRAVALEYGVPRLGKHSVDELKVGDTWRLGANEATTIRTEAPLLLEEGLVAPGSYRVNLGRPAAEQFQLTIEGAGTWTEAGSADFSAPAKMTTARKPNEKLEISLAPVKEQPDPELRALAFEIQFGAPVVTVPISIAGTQTLQVKGFTVDAFKLPAELVQKRLDAGKMAPVASLVRKGKPKEGEAPRLNVLLGEKEVTLLPAATAPTDNNGFGPVPTPEKPAILRGTVQWSDATPPAPHLVVETATLDDAGSLHLKFVVGARRGELTVATARPRS